MEKNKKFRNHFSIVFQNTKGLIMLLLMAFLSGIMGEEATEAGVNIVWGLLIWVLLVIAFLGWKILLWRNTWITIGQQTIIIECNTWARRKMHTIGIATVSTVNLEQNLMEMLFGTCKVRLDTNSLSTADATDVTIMLKRNKAEEVKNLILKVEEEPEEADNVVKSKRVVADGGDIFLHGIFSSRFLYTLFIPLFLAFEIATELMSEETLDLLVNQVKMAAIQMKAFGLVVLLLLIGWVLLTLIISLVRNVLRYWDFQIERQEDKVVLNYGLTKKTNYSIPVDKIQAIVLKQSFLARIFKQYVVEVVNVGMDDNKEEVKGFLLPYGKREIIKGRLEQILPEFASCLELEVKRQPRSVWLVWLWPMFIYLSVVIAILVGVIELAPQSFVWVRLCIIAASAGVLLTIFAMYMTKGVGLHENMLVTVTGAFARRFVYIEYRNIEYLHMKQNFIARRRGIVKGAANLLANVGNRVQEIPYCDASLLEKMKKELLL